MGHLLFLLLLFQGDNLIDQLAGKDGKTWVFERMVSSLGYINPRCESGEIWTFRPDKTVEIRKCVNHELMAATKKWEIKKVNELDSTLIIDGTSYTLVFPPVQKNSSTEEMFLRIFGRISLEPTVDRRFIRTRQ